MIGVHDYTDQPGELLYQKLRYEPKGFSVRRSDGNGGWVWKLDGVPRVLYRLPELLEAVAQERPVLIAEGEKAVDALVGAGVVATCSGGVNSWRDEYAEHLRGASVVILPDNDEPGRGHAKQIAKSLSGVAASIKVLRLPGLPKGGDAYDWIQAGGTAEQLWELVEALDRRVDQEPSTGIVSVLASEVEIKPIDWLWKGRLAKGKVCCLAGDPGAGKSHIVAEIIAAITKGGDWPCGEGKAPIGKAIILSAEDAANDTIVPRLMAAGADLTKVKIIEMVKVNEADGGRQSKEWVKCWRSA